MNSIEKYTVTLKYIWMQLKRLPSCRGFAREKISFPYACIELGFFLFSLDQHRNSFICSYLAKSDGRSSSNSTLHSTAPICSSYSIKRVLTTAVKMVQAATRWLAITRQHCPRTCSVLHTVVCLQELLRLNRQYRRSADSCWNAVQRAWCITGNFSGIAKVSAGCDLAIRSGGTIRFGTIYLTVPRRFAKIVLDETRWFPSRPRRFRRIKIDRGYRDIIASNEINDYKVKR